MGTREMIQAFGGKYPKTNLAGDNDTLQVTKKDRLERTKSSLRCVRQIHQIKIKNLGDCYQSLGDITWQILCDIYLRNIEGINCSLSDLEQSLELSASFAERYIAILESERLVQTVHVAGSSESQNLVLTELGRTKVKSILGGCTNALAESLV